jgi:hypothetical protein
LSLLHESEWFDCRICDFWCWVLALPRIITRNVFRRTEKDGKKELHEVYTDEQITKVIDDVMVMMDKNQDGYISYAEYTVQQIVR